MNLKHDKLLSNLAFSCNLRHYILDDQEQIVQHPSFKWHAPLDQFVSELPPGWQHVQLSVLALSDSFGVLVQDWESKGRPATVKITAVDRERPNTELWSYGGALQVDSIKTRVESAFGHLWAPLGTFGFSA